jgi:hypothetical protein
MSNAHQFPCMKCQAPTQHRTGYCNACRTIPCRKCKEPFTQKFLDGPICGYCRNYKKRKVTPSVGLPAPEIRASEVTA